MDPKIWSKIPDELLDHIICFLPIKSIIYLRSTCKRFKSLLLTPSFISKIYPSFTSPFSSFLLLSHPQFNHHFPLYNSVSGTWREFSSSRSLHNPCPSSSSLLSASNGLLCFLDPSSSSFKVSNLLSRSSTTVKFPINPFTFELITLVSDPNGFKIFVYSCKSVFIYDSKLQSWRKFDGFNRILSNNVHQQGVYGNGYLYFTTSHPFYIIGLDLTNGIWENPKEMPTDELAFARLVISEEGQEDESQRRKVYVIGGVGRNGISRCMKLWEMEEQNESNINNWVEVESLPDLMYKKLVSVCYHNYEHIYCFWHNGMICICCYSWPEILYYRVSRRTWHWLPKCPGLTDKWSCGFRWFSFVPKFYSSF